MGRQGSRPSPQPLLSNLSRGESSHRTEVRNQGVISLKNTHNSFCTWRLITFFTTTEKSEKSEGFAFLTFFTIYSLPPARSRCHEKGGNGGALTLLCGGKKGN